MKLPAFVLSPRNFSARLVAGMLLLNLVVMGLAAVAIYKDRLEHEARARVTTRNIALLLEREIGAVFDRVDLTLRTVAEEFQGRVAAGPVDEARLNAFLKQQHAHLPEVISLRMTDANGGVRYGEGVLPTATVDISDRDHFILARDKPQADLVIAKPVKARISQAWAIPVSRRLNRPDGAFAGIVYVNVPLAYWVRKFAALDLGAHGLVALRSADHHSMARFPEMQEGDIGQFALSDQLRSLLKDNPSSVTYVAPSPVDGVERTFSYAKLAAYPLYVVVGLATQDTLDEW